MFIVGLRPGACARAEGSAVIRDARSADLTRQPTQWARLAARVVDTAARAGADADALRRAADLAGADLWAVEARVPLLSVYALLEAADAALVDPRFCEKVASGIDVEFYDALGFLILTSPTFGVSMERMLKYQRIWNDGERYAMEVEGDRAHIRYEPFGPSRRAHELMAELFAIDVAVNAPRLLSAPASPIAVRLRRPSPEDAVRYASLFGAPVAFAAPIDEVVLPAALLDRPMPLANEAMNAFFARYADATLARLEPATEIAVRVERLVAERLPDGGATLRATAAMLGMSERTLQRRLRAEGTTFEDLVDGVRRARSLAYLDARMPIAEVAYLLGYAEPSVFHRAFKRWTGHSPEAWRSARPSSGIS
jgi:AraC-like DNA-binding protein